MRGNNRRRGRGNNRQGGGQQQLNRIDSRARGNAPQLLEKYRKLAHDAHLNGDRIQEEYYLQFADHYFRVLADARQRQEEQRTQRQDRWQEGGGEGNWREEGEEPAQAEFSGQADYSEYDSPEREAYRDPQREPQRDRRPQRQPNREMAPEAVSAEQQAEAEASQGATFEAAPVNPFVRDNRGSRGLRPRREDQRTPRARQDRGEEQLALDPASLPPAISVPREDASEPEAESAVPAPRPRGRPRRKPVGGDSPETVETTD